MARILGAKEQEILDFLHARVFDPVLQSPVASKALKTGARYSIMRLEKLTPKEWFSTSGQPSVELSVAQLSQTG